VEKPVKGRDCKDADVDDEGILDEFGVGNIIFCYTYFPTFSLISNSNLRNGFNTDRRLLAADCSELYTAVHSAALWLSEAWG
jgi:hypothetical protein